VPTLNYDLSIMEALKIFAEYGIYDLLVVVKDRKPLGVVSKKDLLMAQHRSDLKVGDITSSPSLPKVKTFKSSFWTDWKGSLTFSPSTKSLS
jgi:CBS domain-containing protein